MPSGIQNKKSTLDFLDTIGSKELPLKNSGNALIQLAGFLISEAGDNLDKKGSTATGKTESSMRARDVKVNGSKMELDIEIASTYKFLDQGVKGWKTGKGKYQFKKTPPGRKMVGALKAWIKVRRIATKYKAISANEKKNKKISKIQATNNMAFAMAMKVKRDGIKPTHFFTDAVKATQERKKTMFADALKLDIIESLNDLN